MPPDNAMKSETPGLARCLASLFYELLLVAALLLAVSAAATPLQLLLGQDSWAFHTLLQMLLLSALFAYFGYCWVKSGQTVAMKTWHIKLVAASGATLTWQQALVRFAVAAALFIGLPVVSYLGWMRSYGQQNIAVWLALSWCLLPFLARFYDKDGRFLHDRLAGTRLLKLPKPERKRKAADKAA